jgi:hypothetical protein
MKIYLLVRQDYEDVDQLGAYSTEKLAVKALESYCKANDCELTKTKDGHYQCSHDYSYFINDMEIDGPYYWRDEDD